MNFFNLFRFLIEGQDHTPDINYGQNNLSFEEIVIVFLIIITILLIWLVFSDAVNEYRHHKKQQNKTKQEQTNSHIFCTNCGSKNILNANYCNNCGSKIVKPKEE